MCIPDENISPRITISHTQVTGNIAMRAGGAFFVSGGHLRLVSSNVSNNGAMDEGAGGAFFVACGENENYPSEPNRCAIQITESTLTRNFVNGGSGGKAQGGGALYISMRQERNPECNRPWRYNDSACDMGNVSISNSVISHNVASNKERTRDVEDKDDVGGIGGAIALFGGKLNLSNVSIHDNLADWAGDALYLKCAHPPNPPSLRLCSMIRLSGASKQYTFSPSSVTLVYRATSDR